jgi:2-keto-3-deoxy-6-phosphogluconate aldolase
MPAQFDDSLIDSLPLVLILRGFDIEQVAPIVNACKRGGLTNLEITMNSTNPKRQIQEAIQAAGTQGSWPRVAGKTATAPLGVPPA